MRCPFCQSLESRVVDSRLIEDGGSIRRRRECISCRERYTTYERYCGTPLMVVKKDRRREPFDRKKLIKGLNRACNKRDIPKEKIENLAEVIEKEIRKLSNTEVKSDSIGRAVMKHLWRLDKVAYVRFASVYKEFDQLDSFIEEARKVKDLEDTSKPMAPTGKNPVSTVLSQN